MNKIEVIKCGFYILIIILLGISLKKKKNIIFYREPFQVTIKECEQSYLNINLPCIPKINQLSNNDFEYVWENSKIPPDTLTITGENRRNLEWNKSKNKFLPQQPGASEPETAEEYYRRNVFPYRNIKISVDGNAASNDVPYITESQKIIGEYKRVSDLKSIGSYKNVFGEDSVPINNNNYVYYKEWGDDNEIIFIYLTTQGNNIGWQIYFLNGTDVGTLGTRGQGGAFTGDEIFNPCNDVNFGNGVLSPLIPIDFRFIIYNYNCPECYSKDDGGDGEKRPSAEGGGYKCPFNEHEFYEDDPTNTECVSTDNSKPCKGKKKQIQKTPKNFILDQNQNAYIKNEGCDNVWKKKTEQVECEITDTVGCGKVEFDKSSAVKVKEGDKSYSVAWKIE